MREKFWGYNAVALGLWEFLAFRGKCPTISRTMWKLNKRHPRALRVGIALWCAGLFRHLIKEQ